MFMVVPISVIFLVLRVPVVRIVYGVEKFPWEATVQTATTLGFFSISIFSQSLIYLITRAFYAVKDTLTPVKVSLVTIFLNILLSLVFINVFKWEVWSVALSFSITSIIDMFLMFVLLSKKLGGFNPGSVIIPFFKISISGIFMAISLYLPVKAFDQVIFDTTRTINLLVLTGLAAFTGFCSYFLFTKLFKVEEVELLYRLLRKLQVKTALKTSQVEEKPEIQ
jgi:putative peptidoglycan lipid II flippase